MLTHRVLTLVVGTALAAPTALLAQPSAAASLPTAEVQAVECPEVHAPHNGTIYYRDFPQGIPWRVELGDGIDLAESWVRATQKDPEGIKPDAVRTFGLTTGHNDLVLEAGRNGWYTVEWSIAREGGEPCVGSLRAGASDVTKERPFAVVTSPAMGSYFDQHEEAYYTFDCYYEGTVVVERSCQTMWGPPGDADTTYSRRLDTSRPGWHYENFGLAMRRLPDGTGTWVGSGALYYYVREAPPELPDGELTTEVQLAQQDVETGEWETVGPDDDVVAGNRVRVETTVRNQTPVARKVVLETKDRSTGELVDDGGYWEFTAYPGSTWERYSYWDTSDLAWLADGSPRLQAAEVEVTTTADDEVVGTTLEAIDVRPRPVVLVHGWKSYAQSSWGAYQGLLSAAHPLLRGYAVGDGQFPGRMNTNGGGTGCTFCGTNTLPENAAEEATYIDAVRKATGAHHVDVVAHSMGGLISRYYIQELMPQSHDLRPVVTRLIQMGTPNMGSPLADQLMAFGVLGRDRIPFYPASYHLTPGYVDGYLNQSITDLRGVRVSNLVGTDLPLVGMPLLPHLFGDGIVPATSARWTLADTVDSPLDFHTAMTESAEDFTTYVRPRLAADVVGQGLRAPERRTAASLSDGGQGQVSAVKQVQLTRGGSRVVGVRIEADGFAAMAADPGVRLTLLDAAGQVLATSITQEGVAHLRLPAEQTTAGAARLRVTDLTRSARTVDVLTVVDGTGLVITPEATARRNADGVFAQVSVRVASGAAAVPGAVVKARLVDGASVTLVDDGNHGDGRARDGVFGGHVPDLADGENLLVVEATGRGRTRMATVPVQVASDRVPDGEPEVHHPPVVSLTSPRELTVAPGAPVVVEASYQDADAGDRHTGRVSVDGVLPGERVALTPNGTGGGTLSLTRTFDTAGVHEIVVSVVDRSGRRGRATVTVTVADDAPLRSRT